MLVSEVESQRGQGTDPDALAAPDSACNKGDIAVYYARGSSKLDEVTPRLIQ